MTRVIKQVRRHLLGTKNAINMLVYQQSIHRGLDLATPLVISHANSPPDKLLNRLEADKTLAADKS